MLVSHSKRFIFLKTHKTASTSVELLLKDFCGYVPEDFYSLAKLPKNSIVSDKGIITYPCCFCDDDRIKPYFWDHIPAKELRAKLDKKIFDSYFKFCIVRNPYEKFVSMLYFAFRRMYKNDAQEIVSSEKVKEHFERIRMRKPVLGDHNIYTIDEKLCINMFIRYENLIEDLDNVCRFLDIPCDSKNIEMINSQYTPKDIDIKQFYTKEMKEFVDCQFKYEIETFGYTL